MNEIETKILPKYALNLSEEGRILSATFSQYAAEGMPLVDKLPEGNISDYLYIEGEYIHDPLPEPEPEPTVPTTEDMMNVFFGV